MKYILIYATKNKTQTEELFLSSALCLVCDILQLLSSRCSLCRILYNQWICSYSIKYNVSIYIYHNFLLLAIKQYFWALQLKWKNAKYILVYVNLVEIYTYKISNAEIFLIK